MHSKDVVGMANSVDPDQTASLGAIEEQSDLVCTVCSCQSIPKT